MALPVIALRRRNALSSLSVLAAIACGPGPLPPENAPTELSAPLEPMPVQVESTVHPDVKGSETPVDQTPPVVSE
jgi:hypothetical protein